jgi:hypothetical protein
MVLLYRDIAKVTITSKRSSVTITTERKQWNNQMGMEMKIFYLQSSNPWRDSNLGEALTPSHHDTNGHSTNYSS